MHLAAEGIAVITATPAIRVTAADLIRVMEVDLIPAMEVTAIPAILPRKLYLMECYLTKNFLSLEK